ncbi:metal ABC transporter substrate-binding protein [Polymorphospora rubra]|uniref:metal ABC transporter substrate-binding protein n=1 Tax=Polymorphospora rubra TaxID=338584 RepID=UPI0033ED602D
MFERSTPRIAATCAAALLVLGGAAACGDDSSAGADGNRVDVVAAFYPLQFVAERVGGDAVAVTNLVKPGAESHDLELNPQQVGQLTDAEVVIYLKGFQPAVDEAVTQQAADRAFDVATAVPLLDAAAGGHDHDHEGEGEDGHDDGHDDHGHEDEASPEPTAAEDDGHDHDTGGKDPHFWLDPTRLATVADEFAKRLGEVDADRAADYTARAQALRTELTALDQEYEQGLATCQRRELVTSHSAFGYLADRYKLEQIGITGLTPEDEPSPQRLAEVTEEAKLHGATTIFFETLVSPKVAETIAREVGAQTAVLDPLEGLQAGSTGDYLSVMRANLTTLKPALGCS